MLLVKTKLKKSSIHGLGVFADQNIKKGAAIWEYNPIIDKEITKREFNSLPKLAKKYMIKYAYLDENNKWILCGDDGRFFNHSKNPNCNDETDKTVAARNIKKGEELTSNYYTFDVYSKKEHSVK